MKTRFLWIEDGAVAELKQLLGPVFTSGRYDAVIALDITDGIQHLKQSRFDAVVVDIRVPPGSDPEWIKLYSRWGGNKSAARLGLKLLSVLFDPREGNARLAKRPTWLTPDKVGVFTVDSESERERFADPELSDYLEVLGIQVYEQKTAQMSVRMLLEIVERIVQGSKGS